MERITSGAVEAMNNSISVSNPVLLLVDIAPHKTMANSFCLTLSDGTNSVSCMTARELAEFVEENNLAKNDLLCLKSYKYAKAQGMLKIIAMELEVVQKNIDISVRNSPPVANTPVVKSPQTGGSGRMYGQQPAGGFQTPGGNGPVMRNANAGGNFTPINALNPYGTFWILKARVTAKSDIRTWDKGNGNAGKLFSVDLVDNQGDEIRATFFKAAVDKFYDQIQKDHVYSFSKGKLKTANKQFTRIDNQYEINFDEHAEVAFLDDGSSIKSMAISPVQISKIAERNVNDTVDVMGIAIEVSPLSEFTSKQNKQMTKLEISLKDTSGFAIRVTFWGETAREVEKQLDGKVNQVLAVKGCKISDWGGRTLNAGSGALALVNPDTPDAKRLEEWFASSGANSSANNLSGGNSGGGQAAKSIDERQLVMGIDACHLGENDKGEYIDILGTVLFMRNERMWYYSCGDAGKNRKVTQRGDGTWWNEATSEVYTQKTNRYILSLSIGDFTGQTWCTAFNDVGVDILGHTADEMEELQMQNEAAFRRVIEDAMFKTFVFRLRVKMERGSDGAERKKITVMSAKKMDYVNESSMLLDAIAKYN